MKWHLNKRKYVSLAPKIVTYPWHCEMFAQFADPMSRVSSLTANLQICLNLLRGVWGHLSLPRHLSPPGMVKNFLLRKRGSFTDSWLLTFVPLGKTLHQSPQASIPYGGSSHTLSQGDNASFA